MTRPNATAARARSIGPLVAVGALLIAAAVLFGVGQLKHEAVDRAWRHTSHAAATVVNVGSNRVASVRYVLGGKAHVGHVSLDSSHDIDRGDRVSLRIANKGGGLQLETPFYVAAYSATAAGLAVLALVVAAWTWHASTRPRTPWLPAELSRRHWHND